MNDKSPSEIDDFNWVEARAGCTNRKMFEKLIEAAKADLEQFKLAEPELSEAIDTQHGERFFQVGLKAESYRWGSPTISYQLEMNGKYFSVIWRNPKGEESRADLKAEMFENGECWLVEQIEEEGEEQAEQKRHRIWEINRRFLEQFIFVLLPAIFDRLPIK